MRHLISIILISASALCLAMLTATLVLWPTSYRRSEVLVGRLWWDGPVFNARNNVGSVAIVLIADADLTADAPGVFRAVHAPNANWNHILGGDNNTKFDFAGLRIKQYRWARTASGVRRRDSLIVVPFYLI